MLTVISYTPSPGGRGDVLFMLTVISYTPSPRRRGDVLFMLTVISYTPSPSGRGLGRGGFNQITMYLLKYRIDISQYFVIPESHNLIIQRFEKQASLIVLFHLLQVLSAIDLDYQSRFQTQKIDNIGFNDHLTLKFVACHSMGA
jgi:hypothetical protein